MLRSLVPVTMVLATACGGELGIRDFAEPAPIPAERPLEVVTQVDFVEIGRAHV